MLRIFSFILVLIFVPNIYSQYDPAVENLGKKGLDQFQKGNYDEAIANFTRAIALTSQLKTTGNALRNSFAGDAEAIENADLRDRISVIDPRTAMLYINRGNVYFSKNDLDSAISDYDRALAILPGNAGAYHCRATAWLLKKDYGRALADYTKAIILDPKLAKSYVGRGLVRLEMGDTKAAFEDFELGVKASPKSAEAYSYRGDAKRQTGDAAGALADFEYSMKLDKKLANPYLGRAALRSAARDYPGAISDLTKAIELDGRLANAYANRGYILLFTGHDADGERDLDQAAAMAPWMRDEIAANIDRIKTAHK